MLERFPVPPGRAGLLQPLLASSSDLDFVRALHNVCGVDTVLWVVSARPGET